jgi:hypothetical protein
MSRYNEQRVRVMHQFIHGERGLDVEFAKRPQLQLMPEVYELLAKFFKKTIASHNLESGGRVVFALLRQNLCHLPTYPLKYT